MTHNIKQHAVSETGTVELTDAAGEPLYDGPGATEADRASANRLSITVFGPGSRTYEEADAERTNRLVEITNQRGGKFKLSAEERRQVDATFHARVTQSFNHFDYNGANTFDAFKAAYMDGEIGFILAQVKTHLGDWGNFKKSSAAGSDSSSASTPG